MYTCLYILYFHNNVKRKNCSVGNIESTDHLLLFIAYYLVEITPRIVKS